MIPGLASCPVIAFKTTALAPKIVTIAASTYDVNLRTLYNAAGFPAPVIGDTVVIKINAGVIVGASSTGVYALQPGLWPELDDPDPLRAILVLVVNGRIQGAGGRGGGIGAPAGAAGGPAFNVTRALNLATTGAQIWSGGGGGGGFSFNITSTWGSGGGGAGSVAGAGGSDNYGGTSAAGQPGSSEAGGIGMRQADYPGGGGGAGGGPGASGSNPYGWGSNYTTYGGGGPGYSVYGMANCTFGTWDDTLLKFTATGVHGADIRGPTA